MIQSIFSSLFYETKTKLLEYKFRHLTMGITNPSLNSQEPPPRPPRPEFPWGKDAPPDYVPPVEYE